MRAPEQTHCGHVVMDRIFSLWLAEYKAVRGMTSWNTSHLQARWFWDGFEHVAPVKEAMAQKRRIENRTTTLAAEYARQGKDWEEEWAGVGHSTKIDIAGGVISASGIISRDTAFSRDIVHSGKLGFPWQASIGGPVHKTRFLTQGQKEIVNGKSVEGPLHIVQKMMLKEISFVEYGADPNTSASVEAIAISGENTRELFMAGEIITETKTTEEKFMTVTQDTTKQDVQASEPTVSAPVILKDAAMEYRTAIVVEQTRINAIREKGKNTLPDLELKAIAEGWPVEKFELEHLRGSRATVPQPGTVPQTSSSTLEVVALSAAGIPMRQLEKRFDEKTLDAYDKFRGMGGLQEFCEVACGVRLPCFQRDAHGWLEAAFSTTSLLGILSKK